MTKIKIVITLIIIIIMIKIIFIIIIIMIKIIIIIIVTVIVTITKILIIIIIFYANNNGIVEYGFSLYELNKTCNLMSNNEDNLYPLYNDMYDIIKERINMFCYKNISILKFCLFIVFFCVICCDMFTRTFPVVFAVSTVGCMSDAVY